VIVASNVGRIGKKADAEDLKVIRAGETLAKVNKNGDRFEVELLLLDASGNPIGALAIVFRTSQATTRHSSRKGRRRFETSWVHKFPRLPSSQNPFPRFADFLAWAHNLENHIGDRMAAPSCERRLDCCITYSPSRRKRHLRKADRRWVTMTRKRQATVIGRSNLANHGNAYIGTLRDRGAGCGRQLWLGRPRAAQSGRPMGFCPRNRPALEVGFGCPRRWGQVAFHRHRGFGVLDVDLPQYTRNWLSSSASRGISAPAGNSSYRSRPLPSFTNIRSTRKSVPILSSTESTQLVAEPSCALVRAECGMSWRSASRFRLARFTDTAEFRHPLELNESRSCWLPPGASSERTRRTSSACFCISDFSC